MEELGIQSDLLERAWWKNDQKEVSACEGEALKEGKWEEERGWSLLLP